MIEKTLTERGKKYGDFKHNAMVSQCIKEAMKVSPQWKDLPPEMKESLEMVAHKIGRILCGDPKYKDSWHDIVGYITLIEKDL